MARGGGEQRQTKTGSVRHPSGMMKRRNSHERLLKPRSTRWKEEVINGHAMFLGCLLIAVRGLGFLMLTWITVVLLGGFISNLGTVDFWSLTVIALLQIIGVFRLFHELKYRDIGYYFGPNLVPCCVPCYGCGLLTVAVTEDPDSCFDSLESRMDKLYDRNYCLGLVVMVISLIVGSLMMVVGIAAAFLVLVIGLGVAFGVILPAGILVNLLCLAVVVVHYAPIFVAICSVVRVLIFRRLFFTSASDGPGMFGSNASQLPNLTPAVNAAYWLGVAQGAVLLYWHLCYRAHTRIIKDVTTGLGLESESEMVWCYWQETAAGCEKDLTFAAGRNLMTYAVELLESKSPDKFLPGIRILGTVIRQGLLPDEELPEQQSREDLLGRLVLIKQLLTGSESFCNLIAELLQMLGPRSPYGTEIRGHAARIVLLVVHEICLEEHPEFIQCISSLLDPFESKQNPPYGYQRVWQLSDTPYDRDWCLEPYERRWLVETCWEESPESGDEGDDSQCDLQAEGYMDMVWLGLSILEKLADDEHKRSVMSSTDGLLPRIMAPLCCNVLHLDRVDHQAWGRIVAASLAVVYRLAQAPGEDGKILRSKISGNQDAISTILESILQCPKCPALETAMELLTLLCMDSALGMQEITKGFIQFLLNTLADSNCKEKIRTLAGRKLAVLSVSSQRAEIILTSDGILDSLKDIFLSQPRSTLGIIAVEIMDHICGGNYTVDGECHRNMKNAMKAVMPQVLMELFHCDSSTGETTPTGIQGGVEPLETEASIAPDDIENRITSQGNSQIASSPSHQQNREAEQKENVEWNKALLSLSVMFFDKFASDDDQNLLSLLDEVAPKLTKMADANMQPTADSLRIMKLITKLVISLVRHGYLTEGMDNLMTSLTTASNKMLNLDGLLLCSGVEGGANRTFSTLCSLVKEAQKLVDSCNAREGSMVQDSSPGNN
ncbi:unnamed protein product [Urochloa decumbens]|uniref:Uncharacterized protein n=1 Tax=Urochloa decumbens TaxID=240449 RepID=A0ABC8VXU0_9POAL